MASDDEHYEGATRRRWLRVFQSLASSGDVHVCRSVAHHLTQPLPGHSSYPLRKVTPIYLSIYLSIYYTQLLNDIDLS
jgi:hypothetical protein